jgi:hypothetical protein
MPAYGSVAVIRRSFRQVLHLHHWGLGFKQSRFHHVGRVERDLSYSVFRQSRLSPSMLLSRRPFGVR